MAMLSDMDNLSLKELNPLKLEELDNMSYEELINRVSIKCDIANASCDKYILLSQEQIKLLNDILRSNLESCRPEPRFTQYTRGVAINAIYALLQFCALCAFEHKDDIIGMLKRAYLFLEQIITKQ